ncbi:MAG: DinB family protein [Cyclobacteriaceae bacterium]
MSINKSAHQILDQLDVVIAQLPEGGFGKPLDVLSQASIGQHVRHTLEFFLCLMDAKNNGVINYDERGHDSLIESDAALARSVIKSIRDFLNKEQADFSLKLEADYQIDTPDPIRINSNYYRELAYNIEHAIHHMALIKIGVKHHYPDVELPDYFGVASSTVRFQKSQ